MKETSLSYSGGNYVRMDEWMLNVTGPGASRRAFVLFWVEETQLDETFHLGRTQLRNAKRKDMHLRTYTFVDAGYQGAR